MSAPPGMQIGLPDMEGAEPPVGLNLPGANPGKDPNEAKYLKLIRELTDTSAILVVKVATCKCDKKNNCKLFIQAQKIADILDELQESRPQISNVGVESGKGRRRSKG